MLGRERHREFVRHVHVGRHDEMPMTQTAFHQASPVY
jgi:hypothetical protein